MKNNKKDLFDLVRAVEEKLQTIKDLFGECDFLDEELQLIYDLIMSQYLKPKTKEQEEYMFERLIDFGIGDISKKELFKKLNIK